MLKHLDREDLNQLWRILKESLRNRPPISDKEMELSVELNRLYEPDEDDQLWTHTRAEIPEADTPPWKRLLLTAPRPGCEVGESSATAARQPGPTMARSVDRSFVGTMETRFRDTERRMMTALEMEDRAAVRAEIKILRRERLAYEQEILKTQARCHEWQRQTADDFAVQPIMRTQALKAGARIDTLEDTGSSSETRL
nr:hypothetical protein [Tanacetum cinerariifolium]